MVSNFIKLPFVIKIFVLSIFEQPHYTGFTAANTHQLSIKLQLPTKGKMMKKQDCSCFKALMLAF